MNTRPTAKGRPIIVVGDATDHDGMVVTGATSVFHPAQKVARLGDLVSCPRNYSGGAPHGINPIIEGEESVRVEGLPIALEGHRTECGCALIAQQVETNSGQQSSPAAYLTFDGQTLCWVGPPHDGHCWPAVSGADGYQTGEYQHLEDQGPLPEGIWIARQERYQSYDAIPWIQKFVSPLFLGTWPGTTIAWGRHRIWLEPKEVPDLYGRSGFAIHGGNHPGSIGCIDLTFGMPEFTRFFLEYGGDLEITVEYAN